MYRVGNVVINIHYSKQKKLINQLDGFKCENMISDADFFITSLEKLPQFDEKNCIYGNSQLLVERKMIIIDIFYSLGGKEYAVVDEKENKYIVYLRNKCFENYLYYVPSLLRLEKLLLQHDSFVLHSSNVNIQNKAILFTAPSGGGKSTQADLWNKYKSAEIINGDRNIIGYDNNQWFTYGTPFSGSSPYCINKTLPLGAIVILEKGSTNQIKRVDIRGFNRIFSQVTVNPWDQEFCTKLIDIVSLACTNVPVYLFICTKDESAVDKLYENLIKDGVL